MYICAIGHYLPENEIPNSYFLDINGLTDEWIVSRTGIKTRRRAAEGETTNTMAVAAMRNTVDKVPFDITEVDLIVGSSYSLQDTVYTIAHAVQREFKIEKARAVSITSACSSFANALEIVEGYFATGKASKAIVVASENNNFYGHENDEKSGHLWGDGAATVVLSKERITDADIEVVDIVTHGLGHIGKASDSVWLAPATDGLVMPNGRDVFIHACTHMTSVTKEILERNNMAVEELTYVIPHQANVRIINYVANELKLRDDQSIVNIDKYGNTGTASTPIALSESLPILKKGDTIIITVFGGGYSSGGVLLKV